MTVLLPALLHVQVVHAKCRRSTPLFCSSLSLVRCYRHNKSNQPAHILALSAQWALMGVNIGAFLVLLLIVYHRRPDLLTFAAFRAKQALLGLKRRLCCESKFELFEYQDPSWLDDDGCSACSDPALGERRDSPAVASHRLTAGAIRGGDTARCTTTPQGTTAASESESASSYDITCDTYDTYGDLVSSDPVVMEYLQEQVTREGFDLTGLSIAPPSSSASYGPFSARVQPLGSS